MPKLFFCLNLFLFLLSSFAWPTTFIPDIIISCFGVVVYLGYFILTKTCIKFNQANILIITIYLIYYSYCVFLGTYVSPLKYLPGVFLCFLNNQIKVELLYFVTKWYSLLISFSIIVYIATWIFEIPPIGVINHYIYSPFVNYGIYLKSTDIVDEFRFCGFFFEPGHCAIVGSFLLMAYRFKFSRFPFLIPILISVLLTLSLAGYLLIFIGVLLINIKNTKVISCFALILSLSYIIVSFVWDGGNNPVNHSIVARLEYDENIGFVGNNRSYMGTDKVLAQLIDNNGIWTGLGIEEFNKAFNHTIAGAGYKLFILQYGLIGMLVVLTLFWSFSLTSIKKERYFAHLFFIFIVLAFLQRSYTFWFSWQLSYLCSIVLDINSLKGNVSQHSKTIKSLK